MNPSSSLDENLIHAEKPSEHKRFKRATSIVSFKNGFAQSLEDIERLECPLIQLSSNNVEKADKIRNYNFMSRT
jgi:hypothetical protein